MWEKGAGWRRPWQGMEFEFRHRLGEDIQYWKEKDFGRVLHSKMVTKSQSVDEEAYM
jgi:hypothetical protein